jgi:hypothetical protein
MVQLKDDSSEASENSSLAKASEESKPVWPYLLLTIAIGLVAVGAHFIQKNSPDGKLTCPFHSGSGSQVLPIIQHENTDVHILCPLKLFKAFILQLKYHSNMKIEKFLFLTQQLRILVIFVF